jgi:hypothetical protein
MARPPGYHRPVEERARAALTAARGNLTNAAKLLGCSRQNVAETIERYPALRKLSDELMEMSIDGWEEKLEEIGMKQNNPTALLGLLNAHGKSRGYARHANDVHITGTAEHRHLHLSSDKFNQLDDDELERLIEQRRADLAREDTPRRLIDVTPRAGD